MDKIDLSGGGSGGEKMEMQLEVWDFWRMRSCARRWWKNGQ